MSSDVKKMIQHLELSKPIRRNNPNPLPATTATTSTTTVQLSLESISAEEEKPTKPSHEEREGGKLVHGAQVNLLTSTALSVWFYTSYNSVIGNHGRR